MTKTYIGNCTNSFDSRGGSLIPCFSDVSDFAYKDERAIELTKEDFECFVSTDMQFGGHSLKYLFYNGNTFVIYDEDEDIHYFFA